MKRRASIFSIGAILALLLSACSVYVTPGGAAVSGNLRINIKLGNVITYFQPDRGEGSTYLTGERVYFRIRTTQDGYITLTAIDSDGYIDSFIRNVFVRGGVTTTIPAPNARYEFIVAPPRGIQTVRATFTPARTDESRVIYQGRRGGDVWTQSIVTELEPYPSSARDVAQTYFYIR